jgi:hypothetical protein
VLAEEPFEISIGSPARPKAPEQVPEPCSFVPAVHVDAMGVVGRSDVSYHFDDRVDRLCQTTLVNVCMWIRKN